MIEVYSCFSTNRCVNLAQEGRRNVYDWHATVVRRCHESGQVRYDSPADGDHNVVPVRPRLCELVVEDRSGCYGFRALPLGDRTDMRGEAPALERSGHRDRQLGKRRVRDHVGELRSVERREEEIGPRHQVGPHVNGIALVADGRPYPRQMRALEEVHQRGGLPCNVIRVLAVGLDDDVRGRAIHRVSHSKQLEGIPKLKHGPVGRISDSLDDRRVARVEIENECIHQVCTGLGIADRSPSKRHNRAGACQDLGDNLALECPKRLLTSRREDSGNRGAGSLLNDHVGVDERKRQLLSEESSDRGLPGPHETDENDHLASA